MGLKGCNILLDNQWNTYYPGQTINGRVDFDFDAPKKIRGISIVFKGEAETKWDSSESVKRPDGQTAEQTIIHSAREEYFNISYYLLGSKSGGEMELGQGTHSFPFTCMLPPTLPSSFEGEYGHVRYTVKVTLDRPWKFDQETKMAFTVVSHMDLNMMPHLKEPLRIHMEKFFCCCWCKSGPLVVDVELPVSGFCSGQTMPFDISAENGSNVLVECVKIKLVKVVKFRCQTPTNDYKTCKIPIAEVQTDSVPGHETKNYMKILEIPPLPPSNLLNCSIIDLDYEIEVLVSTSGCHFSVEEKRPITLGTVPILGFEPPPPEGHTVDVLPDVPNPTNPEVPNPVNPNVQPNYPNPYLNPYPTAPQENGVQTQNIYPNLDRQPRFQESSFGAKTIHDSADNQHTMVSGNFAPRYPTYGFVQPPNQ